MRWWLWPNVLSLDAPLVAIGWHAAFAHAYGVRFSWLTASLLASSVWMIYTGDRLLDARRRGEGAGTCRHAFHRRHRRVLMGALVVVFAVTVGLVWMAPLRLVSFGAVFLGLSGLYGVMVHREFGCLPKEPLCGAIFAAGVLGSLFIEPFPWGMAVLFALLCASNCLVIACGEWEIDREADPRAWPQRWPGIVHCLAWGLPALGGGALILAARVTSVPDRERSLLVVLGLAFLGLWGVLMAARSPSWKRVMADASLLAPLSVFWWLGMLW